MLRSAGAALLLLGGAWVSAAAEPRELAGLPYREGPHLEAGEAERCRLDLYLPEGTGFPTIVWLHGGGLTGGSKDSPAGKRFARRLAAAGVAVAMVEYRLHPAAKFPAYVQDTARAFLWVRAQIPAHGGAADRVYLGGHSAGAYLALMVGLDPSYLKAEGADDTALAGVMSISAQTTTHFTVRIERALGERLIIDNASPLYHVRAVPYPIALYTAQTDMALRVEENRLLAGALREAKSTVLEQVWPERDHGTIFSRMGEPDDPVSTAVIAFLKAGASSAGSAPPQSR